MIRNVGHADRWLRAVAGTLMLACGIMAPLSLELRVALLLIPGVYVLFTAMSGWCMGYRLMGRTTCRPLPRT